jgi:hypothetical protein
MKLKKAFNRLSFTIKNQNKPNQTDADALNVISKHFTEYQKKTVQENLLFAKLYCYSLNQLLIKYGDIEQANKELNSLLSEKFDYRIEFLWNSLKISEVTKVFSDPILKGKNEKELRECFSTHKKFEKDFLSIFEWWTKENVTKHLETNINLSITNFKNHD